MTSAAGEGLLHPVPLVAIALLVLNDHLFKEMFHNGVTGKLSDFAGMAFFPLVLQGLFEGALSVLRRPWRPSRRVLISCAVATAVFFSGVQLAPPITEFYRWSLGLLQWPVVALNAGSWVPVRPVQVWPDPTDLISVPAVGLAVWAGWSRAKN